MVKPFDGPNIKLKLDAECLTIPELKDIGVAHTIAGPEWYKFAMKVFSSCTRATCSGRSRDRKEISGNSRSSQKQPH